MKKVRLLLVDDDNRIRATLADYLRDSGFEIVTAASVAEAKRVNNIGIDLALLDLVLPDGTGLDILRDLRERFPTQAAVMISGEAGVADAVAAVKLGAFDFLEKPLSPEKVELTIRNALQMRSLQRRIESEAATAADRYRLVGDSPALKEVRAQIAAVARTDSTVLLLGESGTGKEVAANQVHLQSSRGREPLVAVNAAAIPAELLESELFGHEKGAFTGATQRRIGKFEQAAGGTLFLDEIAEMPAPLQAKLLRVLEEFQIERVGGEHPIEVNFRLICATNRNLAEEIRRGRFRQDLFFRINVFTIELPPLRAIPGDIEAIAQYHIRRLCARMGKPEVVPSRDLIAAFRQYQFPGNIRELRNILEHLLILHRDGDLGADGFEHLLPAAARSIPATARNISTAARNDSATAAAALSTSALKYPIALPTLSLKDAVARFEEEYIGKVLKDCGGNMTKAAEILGLDRSYLYRKLKSLGLDPEEQL